MTQVGSVPPQGSREERGGMLRVWGRWEARAVAERLGVAVLLATKAEERPQARRAGTIGSGRPWAQSFSGASRRHVALRTP